MDPRVVAVCEKLLAVGITGTSNGNWHDPASAAQLVEGVAIEVSSRLQDETEALARIWRAISSPPFTARCASNS